MKKYGTDFNFFKPFFPKKSKNQIKVIVFLSQNKYKQIFIQEKKENKKEDIKLKAVAALFQEKSMEEEDEK